MRVRVHVQDSPLIYQGTHVGHKRGAGIALEAIRVLELETYNCSMYCGGSLVAFFDEGINQPPAVNRRISHLEPDDPTEEVQFLLVVD